MAAEAVEGVPASRLANDAAPVIAAAFELYLERFGEVTRRAKARFEQRDWKGMLRDSAERLDLYPSVIGDVEQRIRTVLGPKVDDHLVWASMKAVYSSLIHDHVEWELGETFFNSLTRRIFATAGVDPNIEFIDSDFIETSVAADPTLYRTYPGCDLREIVTSILRDCGFSAPFADLERDAAVVAERLAGELHQAGAATDDVAVEVLAAPFFRRKGAYLVGSLSTGNVTFPLTLALLNEDDGIVVDALLTDVDDISVVFSFTRSHFHVDLAPSYALVHYLKRVMPRKPVAELYIALGHHKHGKTELYRDLLRHLRDSDDKFAFAPGTPGMVMIVFTLPSHDVVIKLIRSRFPSIKLSTRHGVRENYALVFRHDRAGRLVEAQEFEHLKFDTARFEPELLAELERDASGTVTFDDDKVVIHHAYLERRVNPLDVYLRNVDREAAEAVVDDFGQCVKDLAANGIFPGELLPKNFGVTRHGRVVCYDYDELGFLTDFTFRAMPQSESLDDELGDEPWFGAGPRDVFPEEFRRFIGLPASLLGALDTHHPELYDVAFWRGTQERLKRGEIIDIFPYPASKRLRKS